MFIPRAIMLVAGILVSEAAGLAQIPVQDSTVSNGNVGVSAFSSRFQTENHGVSTSQGFGGWIDLGRGKWITNVDVAVTHRHWVVGASALRRIEMTDRPEVLHFLVGGGIISATVANDTTAALAGGIGMDIPIRRFLARLQFRVYCAGVGGPFVNQFQTGAAWTF